MLSAVRGIVFAALIVTPASALAFGADPVMLEGALAAAPRRQAEITAFYADRNFDPIWTQERADALIDALESADSHALPVERYAPASLRRMIERDDPAGAAAAEITLTRTYLTYARDVSSGLIEPRSVSREIKRRRPDRPAAELLSALDAAPDPAAHIATLPPQSGDYAALRALYAELTAVAEAGDWGAETPQGPTLRLGDRGSRVGALRGRLTALGDLSPTAPAPDPFAFDLALDDAVRAFQRRHGLNDDGAVGPRTLEALNASAAYRAAQTAVNLERRRWLNMPLAHRRIMVNQADFTVRLMEGDALLFGERVVIGKTKHQTPEFSDEMEYMVFNPSWHVPNSIATEEILPLLQQDPTYLAQKNMNLIRLDGAPPPADPSAHDFTSYDAANFPYRIRQQPNSANALGVVKFMFPNNHAIYLHDTPSKRLFARDRRAYSHGCVRVQDPLALAHALLGAQFDDPASFVDRVLSRGTERYVHLDAHVPVHLLYRTVFFDASGQPQFRADVYGRDARAMRALREAGVAAPDA